ncbi:cell division protein FtsZ, partial [Fusobacterium animalis ATCC 51191]
KSMLKDLGIAILGTININKEILEKELVNNISYSFYNKSIRGAKGILIHLNTWQDVGISDSQAIVDILRNESGKNRDDIMFSIRIENNLKNRIECTFIAGKFKS